MGQFSILPMRGDDLGNPLGHELGPLKVLIGQIRDATSRHQMSGIPGLQKSKR